MDDSHGRGSMGDTIRNHTIPSGSMDDASMGRSTSSPNSKDGRMDPNRWRNMDEMTIPMDRNC